MNRPLSVYCMISWMNNKLKQNSEYMMKKPAWKGLGCILCVCIPISHFSFRFFIFPQDKDSITVLTGQKLKKKTQTSFTQKGKKKKEKKRNGCLRVLPKIHHHHAHVVRGVPSQGQLCQQHGGVGARLVPSLPFPLILRPFHTLRYLPLQAHSRHAARCLVRHHVPQTVARQYQTLVLRRSFRDRHLRLAAHEGL